MTSDRERPSSGKEIEPRILAAWRQWLSALATDAEAALAAAEVYGQLGPSGREAWLDALEEDGEKLGVPKVAVYAPLLSVESDEDRLHRIERAIASDTSSIAEDTRVTEKTTHALRGVASDRTRVAVLVAPLYMNFVQVLSLRYSPYVGFVWAKYDPLRAPADAPASGSRVEGVSLEPTPLPLVVEELALAILAERRRGGTLPPALTLFANIFDARPEHDVA